MPDENKLANIEPETREETFLQDIADGTQTLTPAVRKEEFLRRISAKPGVPSITESDEGKVLTVNNGEAEWGEGGGGAGVIILTAPAVPLPIPEGVDVTTFQTWGGGLNIQTAGGEFSLVVGKTAADIVGPSNPLAVIEGVDPEYGDTYWFTTNFIGYNENGMETLTPLQDDPTSDIWVITVSEETTVFYSAQVSEGGNKQIVPRDIALEWVRVGGGD